MWQRFTESARKTVFYAQEEAGRLGEHNVSTEHLLLGLMREQNTVATRLLDRLGIDSRQVTSEVKKRAVRGKGNLKAEMQLTPRAKRVIDLSYAEIQRLGDNYIGTEHLLLGMIAEAEGLAGRVLISLGATLDRTREALAQLRLTSPAESPPQFSRRPKTGNSYRPKTFWESLTRHSRAVVHYAAREAIAQGVQAVTVEHLFLGLIRNPNLATQAFENLDIDIAAVERDIRAKLVPTGGSVDQSRMELNDAARACLQRALESAQATGHCFAGPDHIALALVDGRNAVSEGLAERGITAALVDEHITALQMPPRTEDDTIPEPRADEPHGAVWPPPVRQPVSASRTTVISAQAIKPIVYSRLFIGVAVLLIIAQSAPAIASAINHHWPIMMIFLPLSAAFENFAVAYLAGYALYLAIQANRRDPSRTAGLIEIGISGVMTALVVLAYAYHIVVFRHW
jgi:ATP-dependent Clp protease ATP-binding subunit ClpA